MPILDDIMDHDVLGPVLRQGREEGRHETFLRIIKRSLALRFGSVPASINDRLANFSSNELETLHERLPQITDIKDLFPNSK